MTNKRSAFLFDMDNTYMMTDRLLLMFEDCMHTQFPLIPSGRLQEIYNHHKAENGNLVDMPEILRLVAQGQKLTQEQTQHLMTIYKDIDLRQVLIDPEHALLKNLGLEDVYFLSMGDAVYQEWKFKACNFPQPLWDTGHITITAEKTPKIIQKQIHDLQQDGYTEIWVMNDRVDQLKTAYESAPDVVICVFMNYGKYAPEGQNALEINPFPVHRIDSATELIHLLLPESHSEMLHGFNVSESRK